MIKHEKNVVWSNRDVVKEIITEYLLKSRGLEKTEQSIFEIESEVMKRLAKVYEHFPGFDEFDQWKFAKYKGHIEDLIDRMHKTPHHFEL